MWATEWAVALNVGVDVRVRVNIALLVRVRRHCLHLKVTTHGFTPARRIRRYTSNA